MLRGAIVVILLTILRPACSYVLPEPHFEVLRPRGLRISVPDEEGLQFFAFHANVNRRINAEDPGEINGEAYRPRSGQWTIEDSRVSLRDGDVLYYWIYAQANGIYHRKDSQTWTVTLQDTQVDDRRGTTESSEISTVSSKPIFEENFESLNTSVWSRDIKMPLAPDYEFCVYHNENHETLVQVNNGVLRIKPIILEDSYGEGAATFGRIQLEGCTSYDPRECSRQAVSYNILPPIISARLSTKNSFSFQYGKIEIRAKFPEGDWLYPEMWLQPKYMNYGPGYASGLILLGLACGNENLVNASDPSKIFDARKLNFGLRVGVSSDIREELISRINKNGTRWTQDFHVYTTVWTPEGFSFMVDGEEVGSLNPGPNGWMQDSVSNGGRKAAPFDQEFYVTIGVGVGGVRVFPDGTISSGYAKPWRNVGAKAMQKFWSSKDRWLPSWRRLNGRKTALEVDYIRVWSL